MQGPMGSLTLTPGPDGLEKVVWSRNSRSDRAFDLPCSGELLANRDGERDDEPPFTCGTYARRSVIKHFLRQVYGGSKYNEGARMAVVAQVQALINSTLQAWSFEQNFLCTCPNGTTTGWDCCTEQADCATEPCPCPVLVAPRVHARLDTTICKYCVIFKLGSRGRTPGRVLPWQPTARRRSPPPQGRQSCSAHRIL